MILPPQIQEKLNCIHLVLSFFLVLLRQHCTLTILVFKILSDLETTVETKYFRFVNILKFHNLSDDNILSVVKKIKSKSSLDSRCDPDTRNTLISHNDKLLQVNAVENNLKIGSPGENIHTLTNKDLKTAAEMFMYLTICPNRIKPWITFYKELFQIQPVDQIILTLNRVMKGSKTKQNQYFKKLAVILLKKINKSMFPGKEEPSQKVEGTQFPLS